MLDRELKIYADAMKMLGVRYALKQSEKCKKWSQSITLLYLTRAELGQVEKTGDRRIDRNCAGAECY